MKLCFFSDIHGNDIAYQAFLKSVENKAIDLMICAGDVCGYYYESDKILTSIRKIPGMIYILGNHDKMVLDIMDGKKNEKDMIQRYGNSYRQIHYICDFMRIRIYRNRRYLISISISFVDIPTIKCFGKRGNVQL